MTSGAKPRVITVSGGRAGIINAFGEVGPLKQPMTVYPVGQTLGMIPGVHYAASAVVHTAEVMSLVPGVHYAANAIVHVGEQMTFVPGTHQFPIQVAHVAEAIDLIPGAHTLLRTMLHTAEQATFVPGSHAVFMDIPIHTALQMNFVPGTHTVDISPAATNVYSASSPSDLSAPTVTTYRTIIGAASMGDVSGADEIRIEVRGAATGGTTGLEVCIGPNTAGTSSTFATSYPVRMTFSGSNTVTLGAGATQWSDWITLPANYDGTKNWMWSLYRSSGSLVRFSSPSQAYGWRRSGNVTCTQSGSGFSTYQYNWVIQNVEVR